jgi:hypothetical protein
MKKMHIYKATKRKQVMKEQYVVENNILFDIIIDHD